jgi:hypothetical protein
MPARSPSTRPAPILGDATNRTHPNACATWLWKSGAFTILPRVNGQCIKVSGFQSVLGHIANGGQVVGSVNDASGNPEPVVYLGGVATIITGARTPFDPASPDGGTTPGWYGSATSNNLHGVIAVLGPVGGSNTLYLLTPITVYDETNAAISYSTGWRRIALTGAYGGHVQKSARVGATATITFTGKSVSVIGATGSGLGSATALVDGVPRGTLSETGSSAPRKRLDTIYFGTRGTHTLRIKVTSGTFEIDAITVAPY